MMKKALSLANLTLGGLVLLMLFLAGGLVFSRPQTIAIPEIQVRKKELPKNSFTRPEDEYSAIGKPLLSLQYQPMKLRLPDLRRHLIYYGQNERPDSEKDQAHLHFSFTSQQDVSSVRPEERLYLLYDKTQPRGGYVFSPGNKETSLWIEAAPQDSGDVKVSAFIKNEQGEVIRNPLDFADFSLKQKQYARATGQKWEIGDLRVDGTLLARQRARWYGKDVFFEKHGGQEYEDFAKRQRIDFGEGEDTYSVYVGKDDALMWNGERWESVTPGKETVEHPLLVVNNVDERLMKLDLWDVDGKGKITLNLLKSNEKWLPQNLEKTFKFVGARTRSQFVFDVKGERMLLSPSDWFVLTEDGWEKITTVKMLDDYIEGRMKGPLFIFEGVSKKEGSQILVGTMFNSTRTDLKAIELPFQPGNGNYDPVVKKKRQNNDKIDSMAAKASRRSKLNETKQDKNK